MSRPIGAALQRRLDRYAELRDAGISEFDARDQLGVSDHTRENYERWYRSVRGLPRREPYKRFGANQKAGRP